VADTGTVDDATIRVMRMPRCGMADMPLMGIFALRQHHYLPVSGTTDKTTRYGMVY